MLLMNLVMSVLPNTGSGITSLFGTSLRLGIQKLPRVLLLLVHIAEPDCAFGANPIGFRRAPWKILAGGDSLTLKR